MSTNAEQLTDLIAVATEQKLFYQADRQASIDARIEFDESLRFRMIFSGTIDPDNADVDPEDGGTFPSIKSLIDAAPQGSHVTVFLLTGRTYELTEDINLGNRFVRFRKSGSAVLPVLRPQVYLNDGGRNIGHYFFAQGGMVVFDEIKIDLSSPLADPSAELDFSRISLVSHDTSGATRATFSECEIVGADGRGLVSIFATTAQITVRYCALDNAYVVTAAENGTAFVAVQSSTLLNGADISSLGATATNIITN